MFNYIKFLSSGPAPSARSTSRVRIEPKRRVVSANGVAASSAASLWLVNFQKPLLILGIAANFIGSLYLIRLYRRLPPATG